MRKYRLSSLIGSTLVLLSSCFVLQAAENSAKDLKTILLKQGKTIVSETFDQDSNTIQGWAKYGTQWKTVDGVLVGSPSPLEYQQSHPGKLSGENPRMQVNVPGCKQGFILKFDFKADKNVGRASFWLGHHRFKLLIKDNQPFLQHFQSKKKVITTALKPINGPMKDNQWYSVIMETHSTHRAVQISGFEPLTVQAYPLTKISPVRFSGSKGEKLQLDNFLFIEGAGLR